MTRRKRKGYGDLRRVDRAVENRSRLETYCESQGLKLSVRNSHHHWIITGCDGELRIDWWPSTARAVRGNSAERFDKRISVAEIAQLVDLIQQELEEIASTPSRRARWKSADVIEESFIQSNRSKMFDDYNANTVVDMELPQSVLDNMLMLQMFNARAQEDLAGADGMSELAASLAQVMNVGGVPPRPVPPRPDKEAHSPLGGELPLPHVEVMAAAAKKFEDKSAAAMAEMAARDSQGRWIRDKPRKRWLRWPRGRYNGQRIVGVDIKFKINVREWRLKPVTTWRMSGGIHWLCFMSWWNLNFEE